MVESGFELDSERPQVGHRHEQHMLQRRLHRLAGRVMRRQQRLLVLEAIPRRRRLDLPNLYPELEAALEAWIEQQPDPSRPDAIRRILRAALGA